MRRVKVSVAGCFADSQKGELTFVDMDTFLATFYHAKSLLARGVGPDSTELLMIRQCL